MRRFLFAVAVCSVFTVSIFADPVSRVDLDWQKGSLSLSVVHKVDDFTPEERSRLRRETFDNLGERFISAAGDLRISSSLSLQDWINRNPRRISDLLEALKDIKPVSSSFSREFGELSFTFQLALYPDLAAVFLDHSRGYTPAPSLFHAASANFTGLLIYAAESYPVHGEEDEESPLVPVLFPRIWDEEMNIVFEPEMMNREDILDRGPVGYFRSLSSEALGERVGPNPVRIAARGLFGIAPSDPIITRSDALSLLNSPRGREILQQGKIAFVMGE
jgi:hypothetical protein